MVDLGLEFLRPWWLAGIVPWVISALMIYNRGQDKSGWEQVVDPILQPYVIEPGEGVQRSHSKWLLLFSWLICLMVLAGPVWDRQEVPVFAEQQAQVVLFDLSRSMNSDDVKPSRVARARFKLTDFLQNASGVQIALIAFAERPYVVSPLSDDANTIVSFVESLSPSIMPAQGSRVDLAIEQGVDLLAQAGVKQGQLILITDSDVRAQDIAAASVASSTGHRLSIVGVGTQQGTPLRGDDGRFLQDANGSIVVPQLKPDALATLARAGNGIYVNLSVDDNDLRQLEKVQQVLSVGIEETEEQTNSDYWVEYGPFVVLALCLCALLLFRRGVFL